MRLLQSSRSSGYTDTLFAGKMLFHGDVLMGTMKTLLTPRCINQRRGEILLQDIQKLKLIRY
ncbi:hypothetical protein DFZ64_23205 [Escherichia coli]|nr:hypothetical protein [Escherichia coli]EFB2900367.1 hypothetical protein [Escherichia coli]EFD0732003.1 hypothetical protein [Escherichia coli]EFD0765149.1 hypothetical protein [Escherichia coli]